MKELHRRALAFLPLEENKVNSWFELNRENRDRNRVIEQLCISHERLRTELSGAMSIIEDDQKALEAIKRHFLSFVSFAATCKRENTYEWMCLMLDWLNGALGRLDPDSFLMIVGASHFEVVAKEENEVDPDSYLKGLIEWEVPNE